MKSAKWSLEVVKTKSLHRHAIAVLLVAGCALVACRQKMADQPRYEPLQKSEFFEDGRSARPLVAGTVARGQLRADEHFYTGKSGEKLVDSFPFAVSKQTLDRGQERYDIFCSPCHDRVGNGQGIIVQRGFRPPPSLHIDRLREAPVGHHFNVITNGLGAMPKYAAQISARDRWRIVAYIRTLQLSQYATLSDVPERERRRLLDAKK